MATRRFAAYVAQKEGIELDMMHTELNLSKKGPQAKKDAELLKVMRLATKKVMSDIKAKRRAKGGEGAVFDVVTWEDVADELDVPRDVMRALIERDPRKEDESATLSGEDDKEGVSGEKKAETKGNEPSSGDDKSATEDA